MNLDLPEEVKKIDIDNEYSSIPDFPKQVQHAWNDTKNIVIPEDYKNITNLVMCGMGGSGLGARVIESVYKDELKVPLTRINDYDLPNFVNENSLVICSSYSGTTEETLENVRQAKERQAKWMAIGADGDLIKQAKASEIPYYQIVPTYNPSKQPRMAIGYSIIGQLVLLSKAGLIDFGETQIHEVIKEMEKIIGLNKIDIASSQNPAKVLAFELRNKIVALVSAGHLVGALHVSNNQFNENAKTFTFDFTIPELNHHLMEGLANPRANPDNLHFVFIDSNLFSPRIAKRFEVTKDIVGKNAIAYSHFSAVSASKIAQAFEVIQFGAFVNYYLAILNKQNPTPIPWVDYFKQQLAEDL
jgi:glucose/mannose-6-phosphate isomerase